VTAHAALTLTACAAGDSTDDLQGVVLDPPPTQPSFVQTDTSGVPYDFATETEGKLTLLYFGYLNCPEC
jgi:protein SCO1/2